MRRVRRPDSDHVDSRQEDMYRQGLDNSDERSMLWFNMIYRVNVHVWSYSFSEDMGCRVYKLNKHGV